MQDVRTKHNRKRQGAFHVDGLLLVFLILGWLLIFVSATLALRRNPQRWLRVQLVPDVSADYSVDAGESPRLAPVRFQIVEAVRQDGLVATPAQPSDVAVATPEKLPLLVFRPTRTPAAVLTPTLTITTGVRDLIVSVGGGPYAVDEGSPITLVARGASLSPGAISYRWDLDGDGVHDDGEGERATAVFYDEGEYRVGVEARDAAGRVTTATTIVGVSNVAPKIYGTGDKRAEEGEKVRFSAAVFDPGHDVLFYAWDFGDGAEEMGTLEPEHTYVNDGEYEVRFRAQDNDGGKSDVSFVVRVANLAPEVEAGPDQELGEGELARFSGRARDEGRLDTLSYAWDLDYDGSNFRPEVVGPTASRVYPDGPADIVAALRVRDQDGGEAIDTVRVRVNNVAPRIEGISDDGPVGEGSPLILVVQATDVGSDTLKYAFDWENDGVYDLESKTGRVTHTWNDEGDYTVGLMVEDEDGGRVSSTRVVQAYNEAPRAEAGAAQTAYEGAGVIFDGSGSIDAGIGDVLSYEWEFGDGSGVVTGTVVTHVYGDNRAYTATLRVRDDSGAEGTDAVAVNILNANPVAEAGADERVREGDVVRFSGQASDPGAGDVLQMAWDLDYDGRDFEADVEGTPRVEWRYGDGPARYVVAFRVRDDDYPFVGENGGDIGEAIDTLEVIVDNQSPVVEAGGPYVGYEGEMIRLSGVGTDVAADVLSYEWDLDGDGVYEQNGPSVARVWPQAGDYQVRLRVTDDDGGVGQDTAQVLVGNAPPVAEAGGPYSGAEGIAIELIGSGTNPTSDPLTYTWDLDYNGIFETPGQAVTHTWADDGVYTVTLRVEDVRGGVDTDDAVVTVSNVPPTAYAGGPYVTTAGITLTLSATATDVLSDTLTYTWDLDTDGSFDDGVGQIVTYVWTTTGVYTVVLQVDDGDGGVATDETTVNVNAVVPVAWLGASYLLVRRKKSLARSRNEKQNAITGRSVN